MQNKLFVGSLPESLTSEGLKELFTPFGEITEAIVITDKNTKVSKRFGFVTYATQAEAEEAIKNMDQKLMEGKNILVTFSKPTA